MNETVLAPPELDELLVLEEKDDDEEYHLIRFGKAGTGEIAEAWCGLKMAFTEATQLDFSMKPCKPCIKKKQEHNDELDKHKKD